MDPSTPFFVNARRVLRIREHTLLDVSDLLGADTFSLVDEEVTFTRRQTPEQGAQRWMARLGDWLILDDERKWQLVADSAVTEDQTRDHVMSTIEATEQPPSHVVRGRSSTS